MTPEMKTIIVSNYCPLYAMRECFGPLKGPLSPTPAPVTIIGKLLLQQGNETPDIYEVVLGSGTAHAGGTSDPVKLTLENYMLPYDEIHAMQYGELKTETPPVAPPAVTPPAVDETPVAPVVDEVAPPVADEVVAPAETVEEEATETTAPDEDAELAALEAEILAEAAAAKEQPGPKSNKNK